MSRRRSKIDEMVHAAVHKVATAQGFFHKSDALGEVLKQPTITKLKGELRKVGGEEIEGMFMGCINEMIGRELRVKDENGIRVFESYSAGERERRYQPLRWMHLQEIRTVRMETRTQERHLKLKGLGYEFFEAELEQLGEQATVDDVYNRVLPKIIEYRNKN